MNRHSTHWVFLALVLVPACGGGGGGGGGSNGPATPPTSLVYSSDEVFGISHVALSPLFATIDGDPVTFSITPALPAGLVLNTQTGEISGTPTAPDPRRVYDVEASNSGGAVNAQFALRIVAPARFAVTTSASDNSFSILAVDTFSGELRRLGQVFTGGAESGPETLVAHPNGRFAYAPNLATSNISVFTVDPVSGWMDRRAPVPCGTGPHHLVIDPSGRFAYVANRFSDQINSYAIDQTNGDLTPIAGPLAVGSEPSALAIDPTGKFLFAAMHGIDPNGMGSELRTLAIDAATGILTPVPGNLALQGTRPTALSVDTVKPLLLVTLETIQSVLPVVYDPLTGAFDPGSLMPAGANPNSVAVTETGKFAYVTNTGGNTVTAYQVDSTTMELSNVGTYSAGTAPTRIELDPTGAFAFVSAKDSAEVVTYSIDAATGALTPLASKLVRGLPSDVTIVPGDRPTTTVPRFAYAAAAGSSEVTSFTIDPATGALTPRGIAPTGNTPSAVAIDPRRRFAWVSNAFGFSLSIYAMDANTGALTPSLPALAVTGKPSHVIVDPSARFLYVTTRDVVSLDDGFLTTFAIDQATGGLTQLDTQAIGLNPTSLGIEPTGRFLYTANNGTGFPGSSGISVFTLDPATGIPTNSAPPGTAPGIFDLAFHPDGRHLYAVLKGANVIARYTISYTNGQLTAIPPPTGAGPDSVGLALTPNGKFAFSCAFDEAGTGSFAAHAVAADGTIAAALQTLSEGLHPYDIAVDATGSFAYVANSGSNTLSVARIDPVTGMMTLGVPVAAGIGVGAVVVTSVTQ